MSGSGSGSKSLRIKSEEQGEFKSSVPVHSNRFPGTEIRRLRKKVQSLEVDKKVLNDIIKEMVYEQVSLHHFLYFYLALSSFLTLI